MITIWSRKKNLTWQCHEMNIFWRSKHFNLYFLCLRWLLSRSFKRFSLPYTIFNFDMISLFWKWLLNHSSEFASLCLVDVLECRPLIGSRENAQESTCHRRLPVWFYRITGGFLQAFYCKNRRFRVFEVGFWKDFQN